jgi:two-component system chemotaxis response regulator CheY
MVKTFLVVDDSMVSRMIIKSIIEAWVPQHVIIEAKDGQDALNKIQGVTDIDIALLDYNMPGMTGLELAAELEKVVTISKRALLTANIQNEIVDKAEKAGLTFINKPITEDVIGLFITSD